MRGLDLVSQRRSQRHQRSQNHKYSMVDNRTNLQFNVLRNALYHTGRRLTFERWSRWANFLTIVLGATAMTNVVALFSVRLQEIGIGASIAIIGALQLVFDFAGRARDHQSLQRDYYALLADIEESPKADESMIAAWKGRMTRIAGDEPPTLRALDAKAYNDAHGSMDIFPADDRLIIPIHHTIFGSFLSFEGYNYQKLSERWSHRSDAG
jgi:hypothetical protein